MLCLAVDALHAGQLLCEGVGQEDQVDDDQEESSELVQPEPGSSEQDQHHHQHSQQEDPKLWMGEEYVQSVVEHFLRKRHEVGVLVQRWVISLTAHLLVCAEERERLPPVNQDPYQKRQTQSQVDVKDIGSNCIGYSHVPKPISCNQNGTHSIL